MSFHLTKLNNLICRDRLNSGNQLIYPFSRFLFSSIDCLCVSISYLSTLFRVLFSLQSTAFVYPLVRTKAIKFLLNFLKILI